MTELAGDVGAKLHTGRSRNDQVATDLRLWCRRIAGSSGRATSSASRRSCCAGPRRPATPTSPATPTCSGPSRCCWPTTCWPTAGRWPATSTGWWPRSNGSNVSPLGAGALAGSSLPLDPELRGRASSGFAGRFENSLDAVSDRDFVAEALFDLALLGVHLSRMGEEMVLWSTEEFGFCVARRRLRHRQLDAAAEEEPRRGRAGAGQGRPAHRAPDRSAGDAEGPAARLQPRPPGGQGAALRRRRARSEAGPARPDAGCIATVEWRHERMQAAADGPAGGRGGPGRAAGDAGACRSARPTPWWAGWSGTRSSATCRWSSWSRPIPSWATRRRSCWSPVWRSPAGRRREGPARCRWPSRWSGSPPPGGRPRPCSVCSRGLGPGA